MAALLSNVLGFLSWSYWLAAVLFIVLFFALCGLVMRRGWAIFVAVLAGPVVAALMPHLNHAYLVAFGTHRSAVIEKTTTFTEINLGRSPQSTQNQRLDLLVTGASGETWPAAVHRNAGLLGPYALPKLLLASGDEVVVAAVDGVPANVVIVTQSSPARWQAGLRQLDAGWDIAPPTDNWVSHRAFRTQIEDFLAEFRDDIGEEAVARLEQRLDSLTIPPPEGLPPELVERIGG